MKILNLVFAAIMLLPLASGAQAPAFEVLGSEGLPKALAGRLSKSSEVLISPNGEAVGSYTVEWGDSSAYFKIEMGNGQSARVDALSYVCASPEAQRILCYGSSLFAHLPHEASLRLYNASGQLVKDLGTVAWSPFRVSMANNGDVFLAGKVDREAPVYELRRYSKDGNLLWSRSMEESVPVELSISPDGSRCVLATQMNALLPTSVTCFDASGNVLSTNKDFHSLSAIEFLGNDKMVVCTGRQFYLYGVAGQQLIAHRPLPGNALGQRPVCVNPDGSLFVIPVVGNPETGEGYRILAFDGQGTLLNETTFPGQPARLPWKIVQFSKRDEFHLMMESQSVHLKIRQ